MFYRMMRQRSRQGWLPTVTRSRLVCGSIEPLESRVLLSTTVFSDAFEGTVLGGWTNQTGSGANVSTRWGLNTVRASAGKQSAFAAATQGGVSAASGYQNSQQNALVRENVSLAGYKIATLNFDYFLNTESGYDVFSVVVVDSAGVRTSVYNESGDFSAAGWRKKTLDLSAFAGKSGLNIEFRFDSDASVTNVGGGVWLDEVKLTGDSALAPGSVAGNLFNDTNGNKTRDTGETPLSNWLVYLDQNRNGIRDTGEVSTRTDASGNYKFTNLASGTYYVAEELTSGYEQTSPGAGGASAGSAFNIDVVFPDSSLTAGQKAAFTEAAARWSQIIVTDLPDVSDSGTVIDDLRITATAPNIDGRGTILGQAAPTGFRSDSQIPYKGFMEFDAEDLAQLETDGQLSRVILHEMAHVLGFGTIWSAKNLISGLGGSDPRFTGAKATASYNALFSNSDPSVPVEAGGGDGTSGTHWRESTFGNELMTGYLNAGLNPLSVVTVSSMADLGYGVSNSSADLYTAAVAATASIADGPSQYSGDLVGTPTAPKIRSTADPLDSDGFESLSHVEVSPANSTAALQASQSTLLSFAHTVFVDTGTARVNIDFGNRKANKAPIITGVTDSPDNSKAGTKITLTAAGVSDSDGTVKQVAFYRESNGSAGLQTGTGGDTLVGTDTSSSDGYKTSFTTTGLAAALYTYYAQATDNGGATSAGGSSAPSCRNTVIGSSSNSTTVKTGTIAGTVFNDLNGNAAKDSGEPGLSGWRVFIDANKNGTFDSAETNVVTGSSGAYSFTSVAAGTYKIREVDQTNWARTTNSPVVTLAAGATESGKNFANFKNASISGKVFNDADRDGVLDSGEAGLSGIVVYDDKNNNGALDTGERTATTDSSGNYTLTGLTAGQRTLRAKLPSGRTVNSPSAGYQRLTPVSGEILTGKHFATRTGSASLQLALGTSDDDDLN